MAPNLLNGKPFGCYCLGIRLKAIEQLKCKIDWNGPFAETPNDFYQKYDEQFNFFLQILDQQSGPVD